MSAHAWAKVWCFWFWTCVFLADVAVGFSTGTSYFDDKTLLPSKIQKICELYLLILLCIYSLQISIMYLCTAKIFSKTDTIIEIQLFD